MAKYVEVRTSVCGGWSAVPGDLFLFESDREAERFCRNDQIGLLLEESEAIFMILRCGKILKHKPADKPAPKEKSRLGKLGDFVAGLPGKIAGDASWLPLDQVDTIKPLSRD